MNCSEEILRLYDDGVSTRKISKKLGLPKSTVWDYIKRRDLCLPQVDNYTPHLRQPVTEAIGTVFRPSAVEVSNARAEKLASILHDVITRGNWPVFNEEDLRVEAQPRSVYDAASDEMIDRVGKPLVYITDILRAAPIEDYKGRRFLFTRAQNSTPVNEQFLDNMEAYAKERGADIVVGPSAYQTSLWAENTEHSRRYDERIQQYLCFGRLDIGPNFFFSGESNIIATAERPIHDLLSFSENKWVVVPHSKQNLVSIPTTDPNKLCSQILSTGSVTIPKVFAKKAGIKSIFHHIFGFVVVEFDLEGKVFCRHVNAEKDGSFYDLNYYVQDGLVYLGGDERRPDYLMPADIHQGKLDLAKRSDVVKTFGFDGSGGVDYDNLIEFLRPKRVIIQDLHDGNVDSHYIDMSQRVENAAGNRDILEAEVKGDASFLSHLVRMHPYVEEVIVDESNHDLRLERYAKEHRYDNDPYNVCFAMRLHLRYLEYRKECGLLRSAGAPRQRFSLHEWAVREVHPKMSRVTWVYDGESRIINDVEVGHHGFRGVNGSKASIFGYVRIGLKISFGDKHVPSIVDGAYQSGVIALKQGYNIGPSSWAVSHILQYNNGKRCIITMNDGAWCYNGKGK